MNERIRELLNEAGRYAYEQNPGENSYGRPVDENKYNQDRDTKFAELIIKECVEQVYYGREEVLNGNISEVIQQRIKQHFGVKE